MRDVRLLKPRDLVPVDHDRHIFPDRTALVRLVGDVLAEQHDDIDGPVPVGDEPAGLLRSAELLLRRLAPIAAWDAVDDLRATVADLVWEANTGVSAGEGRTVAELLDDSDGLAREALLDMSADRPLGMVRDGRS